VQNQFQKELGRVARPGSPKAPGKIKLKNQGEQHMTKLKDFVVTTARPLPVILLADVSGSMATNGKIDALNDAIQSMIESFAAEDHSRAEIHVSVIAFGKGGARLHQPLLPAAHDQVGSGHRSGQYANGCSVRPGREDGRGPRPDSEPSLSADRRPRIRRPAY
jgi:hypothetical protein